MAFQFVVNGVIFEPRFLTKDEWEIFSSEDRLHWGKELRKYDGKAPQQTNDEEIIDRYNPNGEHFATLSFGPLITTEPSLMDFETVFDHLKFESMDDNGRAAIACLREKIWPKLPSDLQKEIKSYDLVKMLALRESTTVPSNNNIIKQMKRLNVMSSAARSHAVIARLYWGHTHLHDTFAEYREIFEDWKNYPDLELGPAEGTTVKSQKKTPKSILKTGGKKNNKDESSSKRKVSFQDADRPRKQTKIDDLISQNEDIETELGNYSRSIVKQGATLDSIKEGIKEHAKRIENLEQIDAGGIATAQKAQEAEILAQKTKLKAIDSERKQIEAEILAQKKKFEVVEGQKKKFEAQIQKQREEIEAQRAKLEAIEETQKKEITAQDMRFDIVDGIHKQHWETVEKAQLEYQRVHQQEIEAQKKEIRAQKEELESIQRVHKENLEGIEREQKERIEELQQTIAEIRAKMEVEEDIESPPNHMAGFFAGALFVMTMGMVAGAAMMGKH
ncbi:hypothetical protein H634G_01124 [Metarhizium anisopliae BRIP 53293]|uniref:Uncharacterized protein n=1 Tax=Metarhizium anisopliae BRIP 53293 TaxID=1291518 RepID=A0A0D9PA56_METAN|nr:hypothetical protein H634G_01124 [Metarhizium anisopliae BRIP 53293]KJK93065.1 hypothetical protein H633G_03127 [Metarhizium anisopliae BRIP 53284]